MAKFAISLVGAALLVSQSALAFNFVSVASVQLTNPDGSPRGHIGKSWADVKEDAESLALEDCGNKDCKILQTSAACVATAYDTNKIVVAQEGEDDKKAQDNVMSYCQSQSKVGGCTSWITVCADGYNSQESN